MVSVRGCVAPAAAALTAFLLASSAQAAPECTDIGPNTRMCSRAPGQTAIVTSPEPVFTNPYPGWFFGAPGIGLGLGGVWIGF